MSGMAGTTSNETELIPHWALGFYSLHEKVLMKELVSESQSDIVKHRLSGTKKGKMCLQVHEDANKELEHLWAIPMVSHKWTWGESLTQDEVRSLWHTSKKHVRSGYETSLKPGIHDGEWSSQDSAPTHTGKHHSLLSADPHRPPPPTSLIYPERFNSSNVQATASSSDLHADITASIHVDDVTLVMNDLPHIFSFPLSYSLP